MGLALSTTSTSAVRYTYSQGIIALIAISVAIFFPLSLLAIYMIRKKCRKSQRGHRGSNTTLTQTDVENFVANQREDKLLDDFNNKQEVVDDVDDDDDKDPLE